VAVKAVFFDVGETLVDETRTWERAADAAGVPRFTLMGILGGLAARGERHSRVWELLGVARPAEHGLLLQRLASLAELPEALARG
jgi:FMN phosphatase YigB (HAD superfamily)